MSVGSLASNREYGIGSKSIYASHNLPQTAKIFVEGFQSLWNSVSVGTLVGIADFTFTKLTFQVMESLPCRDFLKDPSKSLRYLKSIHFTKSVIVAPIIEEILFRVFVQNFAKFIVHKLVCDRNVKIEARKMPLDSLVSILATSCLFGWLHVDSGLGIAHVITATMAGAFFGLLKEKQGFEAAVVAHIVTNALEFKRMQLSSLL